MANGEKCGKICFFWAFLIYYVVFYALSVAKITTWALLGQESWRTIPTTQNGG